jgi:hypothetical protein
MRRVPGELAQESSHITTTGDPEGIRSCHAQWFFVARVGRCEELLWVAQSAGMGIPGG